MSVKRITQLPALSGVAAGVTATLDIPVGPRYHVIWLAGSGTAQALADVVDELRLKINGKVQRVMTSAELDALNKLMGSEYAAVDPGSGGTFYLPIFFAEPWRKRLADADGLAWGTGNLSTFQLEVDVKAGATAPKLWAVAEVDNSVVKDGNASKQRPLGLVTKWFRTQVPINGTTQDIQSFPRRDFYQQLSFFDTDITRVEVKVEGFVIRDVTKAENDAVLVSRGMTPVAARFDVVFDHDDVLDSALPMRAGDRQVQDFQVKLTLSDGTARNIACLYQTIGPAE